MHLLAFPGCLGPIMRGEKGSARFLPTEQRLALSRLLSSLATGPRQSETQASTPATFQIHRPHQKQDDTGCSGS